MEAEILCIGTEILLGDILNTNAQYLSKKLAEMGINVYYQTVVGDNSERLKNAYKIAFSRANIVIACGGLGPTKDDLTKEIGSKFLNKKLVLHEESLKKIEEHFKSIKRNMCENNKKQAYIPEHSKIIPNNNGTAPGCIIKEREKILILLPGPPKEMKPMFEYSIVPYLRNLSNETLYSKTLRVIGVGESAAVTRVSELIDKQTNPTIASYAKNSEMIFRITAKAKSEDEANKIIKPIEKEIKDKLGNNVYGEGEETIETVVAKILVNKNLSTSVAESCTGGMIVSSLIDYPGISKVLKEGLVTYTEEAKQKRLGVRKETIKKYGVVSHEVAREMAEGVAKTSNTDIGISTTGVAGPGGGTKENPVGRVYVGLYYKGKVMSKELNLNGNRQSIRTRATTYALDYLRRELI